MKIQLEQKEKKFEPFTINVIVKDLKEAKEIRDLMQTISDSDSEIVLSLVERTFVLDLIKEINEGLNSQRS